MASRISIPASLNSARFIGNDHLDDLFSATVQATEEAIVNAMVAAKDMTGQDGRYAKAIDHAALVALLKKYGRWEAAMTLMPSSPRKRGSMLLSPHVQNGSPLSRG